MEKYIYTIDMRPNYDLTIHFSQSKFYDPRFERIK